MIKPLYFPHTDIPSALREVIVKHLGLVAVFSPQEPVTAPDLPGLQRIVPVSGDEIRLRAFLNEYRNFAAMNREKASAFLMGAGGKPFYDPGWASQIRSEIMHRVDGHLPGGETEDTDAHGCLWARAFLQIAQNHDLENQAIDSEFETVSLREKQLFEELLGEEDDALDELCLPVETDVQRTPEARIAFRMAAWATLFVSAWPDAARTGEGFYLTHSEDAIGYLREHGLPLVHVRDLDLTRIDTRQVGEAITFLLAGKAPAEEAAADRQVLPPVCLSLYRAPNVSPGAFFARLIGRAPGVSGVASTVNHTVIGRISIQK